MITLRAGLALTLFTCWASAERIAHDDPGIQYTPQEEWKLSSDPVVPPFLRSALASSSHFTWTNVSSLLSNLLVLDAEDAYRVPSPL